MKRARTLALLSCLWVPTQVACSDDGGSTGPTDCSSNIGIGDLVITEIYGNSPGGDEGNEWFEIYNASSSTLNLRGLTLVTTDADGDGRKEHLMREIVIEAGQYLVVGGILDEFKYDYIDYGYGPDLGAMGNSAGRILLDCDGDIIDTVDYVDLAEGKSMQLSGLISPPDASENDDPANFCTGNSNAFFQGELGTPQAANEICAPLTQDDCIDGGAERAVVKAGPGDIVISEFMPSPSGTDGDKEWIELRVDAAVDLNGLQLGRAEADTGPGDVKQTIAAIECLPASPGDYVVLVRSTDTAINGGVAADFPLDFGIVGDNDGLFLSVAGSVIDTRLYAASSEGVAIQVDIEGDSCNATDPYGDDGDLGTPGLANGDCPEVVPDGMCIDPGDGMLRMTNPPTLAGDVTISEWMPNPNGADGGKEWLELLSHGTFDLNGVTVDIPGKTNFTIAPSDCLEVTDGSLVVIAASADSVTNAGLPQVDYVATSISFFNSDERTFSISSGMTTLDTVTFGLGISFASGESTVVDGTGAICESGDLVSPPAAYGTGGDIGTPGGANGTCN